MAFDLTMERAFMQFGIEKIPLNRERDGKREIAPLLSFDLVRVFVIETLMINAICQMILMDEIWGAESSFVRRMGCFKCTFLDFVS